jgi:hypothetical protein
VPPVSYRITADERASLEAIACAEGGTVNEAARRLMQRALVLHRAAAVSHREGEAGKGGQAPGAETSNRGAPALDAVQAIGEVTP